MTPAKAGQRIAASRRNMALLMQLRWIAVAGQIVTIAVVQWWLRIDLPLANLMTVPLLLVLVNVASHGVMRRRRSFTNVEMFAVVLLDVAALAWQLYHSGGARNPFAFLFLLQIVIGAVLLDPRWSWLVAAVAGLFMLFLTFRYQPLALPPHYQGDMQYLYLPGSLICFFLMAILLMFFVVRLDRNRRESDAALAALRQQAAEEDHIVRMGLLASGAAHELGTPLSSLSVILGDWVHMPEIAENPDLAEDVRDIQTELQRCKTIVSGILMSAGEIRGERPTVTTMCDFLDQIAEEWRRRIPGELRFENLFGEDMPIVSDPALKQVIGNVIDNAVEVSPARVLMSASRVGQSLVLDIRDHGPGFTPEMLQGFGRPYASTKGRAGGGLGLFLVVNVMRKLGGRADVANLPDGGASVRLTIPLASLAYDKGGQA
ncbi:MAG: ATP-binding protein [Sphingobium sp.]